jgi:hypothetical protein
MHVSKLQTDAKIKATRLKSPFPPRGEALEPTTSGLTCIKMKKHFVSSRQEEKEKPGDNSFFPVHASVTHARFADLSTAFHSLCQPLCCDISYAYAPCTCSYPCDHTWPSCNLSIPHSLQRSTCNPQPTHPSAISVIGRMCSARLLDRPDFTIAVLMVPFFDAPITSLKMIKHPKVLYKLFSAHCSCSRTMSS